MALPGCPGWCLEPCGPRAPTGSTEASIEISPAFYVSTVLWKRLTPYANVAIDLRTDDVANSEARYAVGFDFDLFPREIAEMALAHVIGDKAEQAYRRGDALDKRRRLMEAWADYCEPEARYNVVRLREAGHGRAATAGSVITEPEARLSSYGPFLAGTARPDQPQ